MLTNKIYNVYIVYVNFQVHLTRKIFRLWKVETFASIFNKDTEERDSSISFDLLLFHKDNLMELISKGVFGLNCFYPIIKCIFETTV
jgi:hypothetical protein